MNRSCHLFLDHGGSCNSSMQGAGSYCAHGDPSCLQRNTLTRSAPLGVLGVDGDAQATAGTGLRGWTQTHRVGRHFADSVMTLSSRSCTATLHSQQGRSMAQWHLASSGVTIALACSSGRFNPRQCLQTRAAVYIRHKSLREKLPSRQPSQVNVCKRLLGSDCLMSLHAANSASIPTWCIPQART